jgi:hypothetical protein
VIAPLWLELAVWAPATQASGEAPTNRNEDGPFHDRHGVFPNMVKQLQRRMVKRRLSGFEKSGEQVEILMETPWRSCGGRPARTLASIPGKT